MGKWKDQQEENKKNGAGSGLFVKLKDGDEITGAIVESSLVTRVIHWIDRKPLLCAGEGCEECAGGDKPQRSHAFLFFDVKVGQWRIVELTPAAFDEVANLEASFGTHTITMWRKGSGMKDTRYRASKEDRIDDDLKLRMRSAEKPDIEGLLNQGLDTAGVVSSPGAPTSQPTYQVEDDPIPF